MADVNAPSPFATTSSPADAVSAVVLDYGNVLYAWEPMAAVAGYVSADDWEEFVVDGGFLSWNERLDRGEPFEQVLADYTRTHPGRPDWVEILSLYRQRFADSLTGPVPGMAALLDDLLERGVALYGLTNFDAAPFERARLLVPQLECFVGIVVSGREHLAKPDDAIFGQHRGGRPPGNAHSPLHRCGTAALRAHRTGPAPHAGPALNPALGDFDP